MYTAITAKVGVKLFNGWFTLLWFLVRRCFYIRWIFSGYKFKLCFNFDPRLGGLQLRLTQLKLLVTRSYYKGLDDQT